MEKNTKKNLELQELRRIRKALEHKASLWVRFGNGVIHGFGTLIGATILSGIIFYFIAQAVEKIGIQNLVGPLLLGS